MGGNEGMHLKTFCSITEAHLGGGDGGNEGRDNRPSLALEKLGEVF